MMQYGDGCYENIQTLYISRRMNCWRYGRRYPRAAAGDGYRVYFGKVVIERISEIVGIDFTGEAKAKLDRTWSRKFIVWSGVFHSEPWLVFYSPRTKQYPKSISQPVAVLVTGMLGERW
jgi:hypothetical protein